MLVRTEREREICADDILFKIIALLYESTYLYAEWKGTTERNQFEEPLLSRATRNFSSISLLCFSLWLLCVCVVEKSQDDEERLNAFSFILTIDHDFFSSLPPLACNVWQYFFFFFFFFHKSQTTCSDPLGASLSFCTLVVSATPPP